jgi:Flp pilus assembly protein TadD
VFCEHRQARSSRPARRRLTHTLAALLGVSFLVSCSHSASPHGAVERIAIIPFENLTPNTDLDWIGSASAAILAYDLTGPRDVHPMRAPTIRDARLDRSDRRVAGYFANEQGAIVFHVTIEDGRKPRTVRMLELKAAPGDVGGAINRLAKELNNNSRSLAGCNGEALRLYGDALGGAGDYNAVIQADPQCMPAYLSQAENDLAHGDRDGAARACAAALTQPNVNAIDRSELEYLCATAKNDTAARLQALQRLASALPSDPDVLRGMGDLEMAARNIPAAVRSYERAAQVDPDDGLLWNTLGYARAEAHDLKGARQALEQYQTVSSPDDTNALDSLGEVSFYLGDFRAAENYFLEANRKNPEALGGREPLKAAEARMMTGDLAGADAILARAHVSAIDAAEWEFITGRRKKAIARLQPMAQTPAVKVQLLLWNAQTGNGPVPQSAGAQLSQAVALLLGGKFEAAAPLLEQIYSATNPTADAQVRTLLAWAYVGSGRPDAARKLLDLYPIPLASGGEELLASLVFPRFVQLRGQVLGSEKDRKLAAQYAGDLPDRTP